MTWITIIDLLGTFVFAISGVMAAFERKFDLVGALILGLVTAVGGGTLRDLLIGNTPVSWMGDLNYLYVITAALPLCFFFREPIRKLRKGLFLFDTIGIGLFTVLGIEKTLQAGLPTAIALLMGAVSASFGGVIRDVLCSRVPLIFRREIYATACIAGGLVFLTMKHFWGENPYNLLVSMSVVMLIRYLAVRNGWSLNFEVKR